MSNNDNAKSQASPIIICLSWKAFNREYQLPVKLKLKLHRIYYEHYTWMFINKVWFGGVAKKAAPLFFKQKPKVLVIDSRKLPAKFIIFEIHGI